MALVRKPPNGLLEISEQVYVFDSCFSADVVDEDKNQHYIDDIASRLEDNFPDASSMIFNFRPEEQGRRSWLSDMISRSSYVMTVMDYPMQYQGCPLLTLEMIHTILRIGDTWLGLDEDNFLILHCERGGWPVLAFMLAALLLRRNLSSGEHKTLEMVYGKAPRDLIRLLSPLNPMPSQMRYLHYISRRNASSWWPTDDVAVNLDCLVLTSMPAGFNGEDGCRLMFLIHGKDPLLDVNNGPKLLFSTPKELYKQADCEPIKINIDCPIQGDVVLECISTDADQVRHEVRFRVMFNTTTFIRSNVLRLNRDEIDIMWDDKDRFPEGFRVELIVSEMDSPNQLDPGREVAGIGEEGVQVEAFPKVQIFSITECNHLGRDAAVQFPQRRTSSENIQLQVRQGLVSPSKNGSSVKEVTGHLELG
nr:formin-like protein 6 [Lolium perenne]